MPESSVEPALIEFPSARGTVRAKYHPPTTDRPVVICVGGFDGGFDGPANGLFPLLATDLGLYGMGVLRVDFCDRFSPGVVEYGVADVEAAKAELLGRGVKRFALVGHSFGGAVMITVAASDLSIEGVVALSTQSAGAASAPAIAPRPLLLIHGLDDQRLPADCSRYVFNLAGEPKQLVLLEGARHSLRQRADDVRRIVSEWLVKKLSL